MNFINAIRESRRTRADDSFSIYVALMVKGLAGDGLLDEARDQLDEILLALGKPLDEAAADLATLVRFRDLFARSCDLADLDAVAEAAREALWAYEAETKAQHEQFSNVWGECQRINREREDGRQALLSAHSEASPPWMAAREAYIALRALKAQHARLLSAAFPDDFEWESSATVIEPPPEPLTRFESLMLTARSSRPLLA